MELQAPVLYDPHGLQCNRVHVFFKLLKKGILKIAHATKNILSKPGNAELRLIALCTQDRHLFSVENAPAVKTWTVVKQTLCGILLWSLDNVQPWTAEEKRQYNN